MPDTHGGKGGKGGGALAPMPPGPLLTIGNGALSVQVAPEAGGRIAQIGFDGVDWLLGHDDCAPAGGRAAPAIAWGSYPMLPWAGRIRQGRFGFDGVQLQLHNNLGRHAGHGVGFVLPWQMEAADRHRVELSLDLPGDDRWPFGGRARQVIEAAPRRLRMELSVTAGERAMPAVVGWHPWFRKPDALEFRPTAMYPRDADGIAMLPTVAPAPGPWDDCFINADPIVLTRAGQRLRLTSDCPCWVVYDEPARSTCIEPQSGPPDAFNIAPAVLAPGETLSAWFEMEWLQSDTAAD